MSTSGALSAAGPAGRAFPSAGLPRLIPPGGPLPLAEHLARYGPVPFRDAGATGGALRPSPGGLIAEVERAGLTGRGGAGFPAGRKMRAVAETGRRAGPLHSQVGTVVVANGTESEPASGKDRLLLTRAPHLVLDGIALAAEAVGATRGYLSLHAGEDELALQLAAAITERDRGGLNRVPIQVVAVPGGYVASQETALVSYLNGGPPKPTFVPPRPFQKGAHGRPTLVQNVETLAHIALIARFGAEWFREMGSAAAGSALVTVSGAVRRPGIYEIALDMPVGDLLRQAGGPSEAPQAILAGGYFGGWLRYDQALGVPVSDPALRAVGATLGPGVLVLLPESACGLAETARIVAYLASQSAGQCGPCLNGLPARGARIHRAGTRWPRSNGGTIVSRGAGTVDPSPHGSPVLRINPIACEAHGLCIELLPELITEDPWGYPIIAPGPVPAGLLPLARRAVAACPTLALLLTDGE
jgi:NADH:ubiquinone oxidoreductase subunit F (NADH-binding)/ferredoxin